MESLLGKGINAHLACAEPVHSTLSTIVVTQTFVYICFVYSSHIIVFCYCFYNFTMPRKRKQLKHLLTVSKEVAKKRKVNKENVSDGDTDSQCDGDVMLSAELRVGVTADLISSAVSSAAASFSGDITHDIGVPSVSTNATPSKVRLELRSEMLSSLSEEEGEGEREEEEEEENVSPGDTIMLSKRRVQELLDAKCFCAEKVDVHVSNDGCDSTVFMKCNSCDDEFLSVPDLLDEHSDEAIFTSTFKSVYLSLVHDYGYNGFNNHLGTFGYKPIGKNKYYRYVRCIIDKMQEHYLSKQPQIFAAIRKYYEDNTDNICNENGELEIDISYDATWPKRGHTSLLGIGVAIEACTGFIIDFEVMSKFCMVCQYHEQKLKKKKITIETYRKFQEDHKPQCTKNYEGTSGGMDKEGAIRLFGRSIKNKFIYKNFVGDGDSSSYNGVLGMNNGKGPYENVKVNKIECINHYQKRLGSRLRKLVNEEKVEVETKTGKKRKMSTLSGKNKLTVNKIDILSSLFGKAIRENIGKTYGEMKRAILATFYHIFCGRHTLCPLTKTSYCYFQRQIAFGKDSKEIEAKRSSLAITLDEDSEEKVKNIYFSLTEKTLLERCLKGLTQNSNESFHSKIWVKAKKAKYVGLERLKFVTTLAALEHNFGYQSSSFLKALHIGSKGLDASLVLRDKERLRSAKSNATKHAKHKSKGASKDYEGGAF